MGRGGGAVVDRRQPAGVAMRQDVERTIGISSHGARGTARARARRSRGTCRHPRRRWRRRGRRRLRRAAPGARSFTASRTESSAQRRLIAVGRVATSRSWPRWSPAGARVLGQRHRQAISGGGADHRRAARPHVADRHRGLLRAAQLDPQHFPRQLALVEDAASPCRRRCARSSGGARLRGSWHHLRQGYGRRRPSPRGRSAAPACRRRARHRPRPGCPVTNSIAPGMSFSARAMRRYEADSRLGAGGGVEIARKQRRQVARDAVAEDQLLRGDRARRIDAHGDAHRLPPRQRLGACRDRHGPLSSPSA